jgi:hypothetical protein
VELGQARDWTLDQLDERRIRCFKFGKNRPKLKNHAPPEPNIVETLAVPVDLVLLQHAGSFGGGKCVIGEKSKIRSQK